MLRAGWLVVALSIALVGSLVGCGGDSLGRHAISGTVKLAAAPLENGMISFTPVDQGTTSSGGKITAGAYKLAADAGLPPGKYKVTINAPKPGTGGELPEGAMPGDPLPPAEEMVPSEWNVNSTQTIEVKEGGPFEFNFEIAKGK